MQSRPSPAAFERHMMLLLLVLSSSEVVRAEAQAWLAAFDEARATGASELQAHRYACGGDMGVFDPGSGMVAGTHAARPPPARDVAAQDSSQGSNVGSMARCA